mmetsp:Transcript_13959/g.29837  ORF Transcript_13959/g.29837 Transcript_13959/m.29837 type:complete len:269 (-) Transcript_13959:431-1237(-)
MFLYQVCYILDIYRYLRRAWLVLCLLQLLIHVVRGPHEANHVAIHHFQLHRGALENEVARVNHASSLGLEEEVLEGLQVLCAREEHAELLTHIRPHPRRVHHHRVRGHRCPLAQLKLVRVHAPALGAQQLVVRRTAHHEGVVLDGGVLDEGHVAVALLQAGEGTVIALVGVRTLHAEVLALLTCWLARTTQCLRNRIVAGGRAGRAHSLEKGRGGLGIVVDITEVIDLGHDPLLHEHANWHAPTSSLAVSRGASPLVLQTVKSGLIVA